MKKHTGKPYDRKGHERFDVEGSGVIQALTLPVKLAKLHLVNMIPESHLLSEEERIFRDLLIQKVKLSSEISSTKNAIIGYLKREGLYSSLLESNDSFSEKRRTAIKNIKFNNRKGLVLKTMMERLEFLEGQGDPLNMEIRKIARDNEDVKLLMTIPGIDYYLVSLLLSYIGDVNRFPNADNLAPFFCVIPETRDSSTIKRRCQMSKEGEATARWALSIAVDTITLRNKPLNEYLYNLLRLRV